MLLDSLGLMGFLVQAHSGAPNCQTNQHVQNYYPHHFFGPTTTTPFAGAHFHGDPNWYPDTGATHHLTAMPLHNSQSYGGPPNVYMGNDDSMPLFQPVTFLYHWAKINSL